MADRLIGQKRQSVRSRPEILLLWVLLGWSVGASAYENDSPAAKRLAELGREIASDYAEVPQISVATLKADYGDALVIDVRDADEYNRSHLPGAVHAPTAVQIDALRQQFPDRDLVFYCTVGVRSSVAVRELLARTKVVSEEDIEGGREELGVRAVNLQGSIFAWANQGEPLVNSRGPTRDVHPFNAWWGFRYLDRNRPPVSSIATGRHGPE